MKKTLTTLILAFVASVSLAQQQSSGSQYDTERSKGVGTGLASMMRGAAPVVKDGQVQRDSNGNIVQERRNGESTNGQLDYFKNTTGFTGAVENGQPARGAAGARAAATVYIDFSCKYEPNARKSVGGYTVQVRGCQISGTTVSSVKFQLCTDLLNGGVCSTTSFSDVVSVNSGEYVSVKDTQVGLGCNDTNAACRFTVNSNYSMSTSTTNYQQDVQQQTAAKGDDSNSARNNIVTMRTKKDADGNTVYDKGLETTAQSMVDCAQDNNTRTNAGEAARTCDGKKTVNAGNTQPDPKADCSQEALCARKATRETKFSRSCIRTFPLTSKVCQYNVKTMECKVTWVPEKNDKGQPTGRWVESSSCLASDTDGGTKFNSKNLFQTETGDPENPYTYNWNECPYSTTSGGGDSGTTTCVQPNRIDYYSWPAEQLGTCYGDPYVAGGSCVTDPAHVDSQCLRGTWFGRTKTFDECSVVIDGSTTMQVGESSIAGCGVCTAPDSAYTCYAATPLKRDPMSLTAEEQQQIASGGSLSVETDDTCSSMDLTGCEVSGSEDLIADDTGLVTSRRENYTCTRTSETCVEYKKDPNCQNTTVSTYGLDSAGFRAGASDDAMNQALATTAVAGALGGAMADSEPGSTIPLLFNGNAMHCDKPTGSWGSNGYYMDCCKISLERPGGKFGKLNKCSEENARLAAARRANYTVYLGDYCSKKLPWPLKKCIRRTQGYCSFPGILPRIIHEQGRKQLAEMASSSATATTQKAPLNFAYYGTTGTWSPPTVVNGVTVQAWQFPAYCKSLEEAEKALEADPLAKDCPTQLVNYFAVCDNPAGCGPLPEYPELGGEEWVLTSADPLRKVTTAVSRYAVVNGSCDPASSQCLYEVSAWPAGVGGRAVVSKQVAFLVYTTSPDGKTVGNLAGELSNIGDFMFRPMTTVIEGTTFPNALPATVRLDFSADGGQTWTTLNIPTTDNKELSLPGSDAKLSGGCRLDTNLCTFQMTGTATVTALPWGSAQNPNCKGFTAGQLSVLDFSKMDFSEWVSSVAGSMSGPNKDTLTGLATTQGAKYNAAFQNKSDMTVTLAAPQGVEVARISPAEGFGPFDATVKVGGYWPATTGDPAKDTDAITAVTVNWGDCSTVDALEFVTQVDGKPARGFKATHRYLAPDKVPTACGGGEVNLTHTVTLKIVTTKSGTQTATLKVKNAWDTMPGAYKANTGNSATYTPTNSATVPGKQTPPPGP